MKRYFLAIVFAVVAVLFIMPKEAQAQYKNSMFGLGVGTHAIFASKTVPSLQLYPTGSFGFESLFKLGHDHWWFDVKLHVGFNANRYHDAYEKLGVLMNLDAGIGVRYYFLTDRIRPFLQFGGGYQRIFYFTNSRKNQDSSISEAADLYLAHQNLGSLNVTPGIEFIYRRNMSIQIAAECQWVIVFNDRQAFGLYPTVMFMFYM